MYLIIYEKKIMIYLIVVIVEVRCNKRDGVKENTLECTSEVENKKRKEDGEVKSLTKMLFLQKASIIL